MPAATGPVATTVQTGGLKPVGFPDSSPGMPSSSMLFQNVSVVPSTPTAPLCTRLSVSSLGSTVVTAGLAVPTPRATVPASSGR